MEEFLTIATTLPTAVYTALVLASLMYWMVSIVGLGGDDGSDGTDGDADVDFEAGHGGDSDFDAGGDADLDFDADGDADFDAGHGHAHGHHGTEGGAADDGGGIFATVMNVLTFFRLRNAPLSITLSVLFLFAWVFTFFGTRYGLPLIPGPEWLGASAVALGALVPAVPITSVLTKPLAPFFKQQFAPGKRHLVGRVGVVRIAGGKKSSAQIRLKDPAAGEKGLLIRVASDDDLSGGDEVLIVDYDDDKNAYVAEPMERVLPSKESGS